MDISLHVQGPLSCKAVLSERGCFKLKPSFPHGIAATAHQSSTWCKGFKAARVSYCINASAADFSRRRQKRMSTGRPKGMGPAPKGFVPKQPIETSNKERDQKNTVVKGDSFTPTSSELSEENKETLDVKIDIDEEEAVEISQERKFGVARTDETAGEANELSLSHETFDVEEEALECSGGRKYEIAGTDKIAVEAGELSLSHETSDVEDKEIVFSQVRKFEVAGTNEIAAEADELSLSYETSDIEEEAVQISQVRKFEIAGTDEIASEANELSLPLVTSNVEEEPAQFSESKKFEVATTGETSGEASKFSLLHDTLDIHSNQDVESVTVSVSDECSGGRKYEIAGTDKIAVEAVELSLSHETSDVEDKEIVFSQVRKFEVAGTNEIAAEADELSLSYETSDIEEEAVQISQVRKFEIAGTDEIASEANELSLPLVTSNVEEEPAQFSESKKFEVARTGETSGEASKFSLLHDTLDINSNQDVESVTVSVSDEDVQLLPNKQSSYRGNTESVKDLERKPLDHAEIDTDEPVRDTDADTNEKTNEEASQLLKLEMEANLRKREIERIAEENFSQGNKLFVYPSTVKPDQDIEVFLNRSLSTLSDEPDVLIMGAFNAWRWKSFTIRLNKTNLKGDWWSCQVHIPREAYKMDFVFFNGRSVYENNDQKDFSVHVEGGMDALTFEDFLLEEKRKELEKLAKEEAERKRRVEEQRRMEAEKAAQEADRAQARLEIERRQEVLQQLMNKAAKSIDNVWYIKPSEFKAKELVRLYYNKGSGPLAHANEVWIHGGHNNWKDGLSIVERLVKSGSKDGDWWHADVIVPEQAFVLDWVFADGPPQKAIVYDNNQWQDFHAIVTKDIADQQYWLEEEQLIYRKLQLERRLREEAIRAKAEKTARMKAETKERTVRRFLLSQKHIVYTEPLDVQAGSTVTVFYNPSNTNLNGMPEVWFRCSFNRWTHRNGPLPPQKMLPAENGTRVKTSVKVPLDAYMMDFVFSEREDGGVFDNKYGMDYHIPVFGGIIREPPMHIVHIAVEMAPIAKVGGLGDVVTSLSRAVQDLNHNVDIILPKYDCLNLSNVRDFQYHKSYSWGGTEIKVWHGKVEGLSVYFLEPQNGFFSVGCVYGRGNDAERFGFFCHAALEFLLQNGFHPDIIHCHDWSSAPVAWLFKDNYVHYGLSKARVVFTTHNLEFGAHFIGKAMAYTDKATTVSPTYSREVARNPAIAPHLPKFNGIINGIDPDIWDPYNDKFIPVSYTSENVVEGKRAAKEALQQRLNLKKADVPLVGVITRLTHQKGIHLIKHALRRTLERGGQVVLLGSAPDPRIQNDFQGLANQLHSSHNDHARLCLSYDEPLSHLIYAGADFILVPSIFEPCGLTQLIAMRYGSIPVVRKTGGLYDTVFDVDNDKDRAKAQGIEPNGFNFDGADAGGVDYALNRAISAWYDGRDWFNSLCKTAMEQDWSWNKPALDYLELYHAARKSA